MSPSSFPAYLRSALSLTTESVIAEDQVEREYVFFGKMEDSAELQKATRYEDQEQWRVFTQSKGGNRETTMRVRKTIALVKLEGPTAERPGNLYEANDPVYTITVKSYIKGKPGNLESETVMSPESGEALLKILRAEGDGMIKRRYFFPVGETKVKLPEGTCWEVDVFFAAPPAWKDGRDDDETYFQPYVKLDFEVLAFDLAIHKDPNDPAKAVGFDVPFPITLSDVVYSQPHDRSPEDEARVKKIMDAYMKAKK